MKLVTNGPFKKIVPLSLVGWLFSSRFDGYLPCVYPFISSYLRTIGYIYIYGWWFGTFFIFPYIGNNHPNWLIFFRGVQTTNQIYIYIYPIFPPTDMIEIWSMVSFSHDIPFWLVGWFPPIFSCISCYWKMEEYIWYVYIIVRFHLTHYTMPILLTYLFFPIRGCDSNYDFPIRILYNIRTYIQYIVWGTAFIWLNGKQYCVVHWFVKSIIIRL